MSSGIELEREGLEEAYRTGLDDVVARLVRVLQVGDRLGKTQPEILGAFMGAFQRASSEGEAAA